MARARRKARRTSTSAADPRGTRERFVDAAAELLTQGGYAAASVQGIAERVGVSTGALYRHFPSKAELFVEVFRAAAGRDLEALRKVALADSPIARLEAGITTYARRMLASRRLAWALVHEPVDPLVDAERLRYRRTYARNVAKLLREAVEAGEIPEQDVDVSAAAITGALSEALVGPLSPVPAQGPPDDVIVDQIVGFCRRAVGARDARRAARAPRARKARRQSSSRGSKS